MSTEKARRPPKSPTTPSKAAKCSSSAGKSQTNKDTSSSPTRGPPAGSSKSEKASDSDARTREGQCERVTQGQENVSSDAKKGAKTEDTDAEKYDEKDAKKNQTDSKSSPHETVSDGVPSRLSSSQLPPHAPAAASADAKAGAFSVFDERRESEKQGGGVGKQGGEEKRGKEGNSEGGDDNKVPVEELPAMQAEHVALHAELAAHGAQMCIKVVSSFSFLILRSFSVRLRISQLIL
jgi:hypothetical protein